MKRIKILLLIQCLLILCVVVLMNGCNSFTKPEEATSSTTGFSPQKIYSIPPDLKKENYSVEDFKTLHAEYLKLNMVSSQNEQKEVSQKNSLTNDIIDEITPIEIREEIGCQVFKVNNSCETYVVYESKVFRIGLGFGGFGVVSLNTCDFDGNGQKDLIYTFSWGSGLHRSHLGIFNCSNHKEEWLDFVQLNNDIMLKKLSDKHFEVFIAAIDARDFIHFSLSKKAYVADVQWLDGKIAVIGNQAK